MVDPDDAFTLLNRAQEKIVVLGADGTYRYLNDAVVDVLGFEPAELVGRNAFDLIHPDDERRVRDLFDAAVAGEFDSPVRFEYRYGTADGGWVTLRSELYGPSDTGIDGYVVSSRDVTEAAASRRRLEEIAAKSPDVLWMFTADWEELLFVNDAVGEVFGVRPETLAERPTAFIEHVHPADRPYVRRAMRRLSEGESTLLDYRVDPTTEFSRWVRVPAEPIYEDGAVVRVAGFVRDVSEEYKRNRQLTVMDNLLRHTIRNDVNVITGTADRILDAVDDGCAATRNRMESADSDGTEPGDRDDAETVAAHARTVKRVGESLLDTAEKQRGVIELLSRDGPPSPIDVAEVAEEAGVRVGKRHPDAAIAVDRPSEARAFTHPEVEQALVELVENAVEHAEEPPDVHVSVEAADGGIEVRVRDNCPPIPPEELLVVTDQREMTDLRHTDGMGLWLAYWVADRSGGQLAFDSHADGNVVRLRLPSAEAVRTGDVDEFPTLADLERRASDRGITDGTTTDDGIADGARSFDSVSHD